MDMFNPFINLSGSNDMEGAFLPKGTLNSKDELPQYQEGSGSNPKLGWLYFVKTDDPDQLEEYVFTEEHKWEKLGYVSVATINGVRIEGDLDSIDDLKIAGKIVAGQGFDIDGNNVVAENGAEVFNDYINNKATGQFSHAEGLNTVASGDYSHSEGINSIASGEASHVESYGNKAIGYNSHAEGGGTIASGAKSHSEGSRTTASGDYSHAEGGGTIASNSDSHAEGSITKASGKYSHAEGEVTTASGQSSHTEGSYTIASGYSSHAEGGSTTTSGNFSHAEGSRTEATGNCSHAEGNSTDKASDIITITNSTTIDDVIKAWKANKFSLAFKNASHVEGKDCLALGDYSHSEGLQTTASGNYSHTEGKGTITTSANQHAQGKYNIEDSNNKYAFIIGNGESNLSRSNAFCVDWQGNIYVNNSETGVNVNDLSQRLSTLESEPDITIDTQVNGDSTNPVQNSSIYNFVNSSVSTNTAYFKGTFTTQEELNNVENPTNNDYAFIVETDEASNTVYNRYKYNGTEWVFEYALNNSSFTANQWETINSGITAEDVEKLKTPATINDVEVTGDLDSVENLKIAGKDVSGQSFILGGANIEPITAGVGAEIFNDYTNNMAVGECSHAEGNTTTAQGDGSHAEGKYAQAIGDYSHAEGDNTVSIGTTAHAEGNSTVANGMNSHAEGKSSNRATYCVTLTDSTTVQDLRVARNDRPFSIAYGESSHVEGKDNIAFGSNSHAEGWYTEASASNSHAEGSETCAMGSTSHAEGSLTTALGNYSHAEGSETTSQGSYSHAEGNKTHANGESSHSEGKGTIAGSNYQHVQGKYNTIDIDSKYAFVIGNGADDANRSNAFCVDWNGNIYVNNAETGVNINDLMSKSSIVKLNSMDEFNALTEKTADWYFIKEG